LQETVKDLEKRGLLQYDHGTRRYDLHPVVRGVAGGGLNDGEKTAYGQRVVDIFNARPHSPYDEAESLDDVAAGVQVVRTLMQMGKMEEAAGVYRGELSRALYFNLEANAEILSLLRPFFAGGWGRLPEELGGSLASYLANDAGMVLTNLGSSEEALAAFAAALPIDLSSEDWHGVEVGIRNIGAVANAEGRLGREDCCIALSLAIAMTTDDQGELFRARLDRFQQLSSLGRLEEAQALWDALDPMGRSWRLSVYRPGAAEYYYAQFRFARGDLLEEHLARAEELAQSGKSRVLIRNLHGLRGTWMAERGEWALAATCLHEAASMARAVGRVDAGSEALLVLAQLHAKQITPEQAREEAERLAASGYSNRSLAELYFALNDRTAAVKHAVAAYKWAWADGEPFVYRYELTKAAELLMRLGEPIPNLPPYNPAKDPPFEWEADVEAAIERLKKEKAERERRAAEAT
jgi:hypothetical protein